MGWIKIEDRLPEEGQKVIYYFKETGIDIGTYTRKAWPNETTNCFHSTGGWLTDDVTHWMPFPEPPVKVEKGG